MWWEWTQITLLDSILFSILSILILYIVGLGILSLICTLSKKNDPFSSFDSFQKANIRILFGFVFVFLLYFLFSFINVSFISTLLIIIIALIGMATMRTNLRLNLLKKPFQRNYVFSFAILVVLLATIFLSSMLITGLYGSTIDDGADHTLFTRIILDNPTALITRSAQPYGNFTLNYPSGSHVLCAFFVSLLGIPIQKIVILMSVVLPSLIALSFYSTLKCLFESKVLSILGLIIASFFTIGFTWGPIGWGGLPVLLSLYLSISSMGLIFVFLLRQEICWLNALILGLIFFISSQTYPIAVLIESLWILLILSTRLLTKVWDIHRTGISIYSLFNRKNMTFAIAFLIPLLFSVPYFYSIYIHSIAGVQFTDLNSASNSLAVSVKTRIDFNWLFDIPALSLFFSELGKLFALAPYSLIVLFILKFTKRTDKVFSKNFGYSLLLIYSFMLFIMGYLAVSLYLPINFLTDFFNPERVWQHIFIVATIMTTIVIFSPMYLFYLVFKRLLKNREKTVRLKLWQNRVLAGVLLLLLILGAGLSSIPIITEQQEAYNKLGLSLNYYAVLTQDDVTLMNWIKENISSRELILISRGDSGQYLIAVTQKQVFSTYNGLENYGNLMTLLTANSSDVRTIPYMIKYNISYVYIGSTATNYALEYSFRRSFNATQFLTTPYFSLTKQVGNAWLFEFNSSAALKMYNNENDS